MSRNVDYPERPISEQLVDLHIYIVPPDLWRDHLNSAINQIINDTVSAGFIRVLPESSIYQLREELEQQLGDEILPREFVFLKSVGRCLTRIRPKQEFQLKVKNFLPPLAYVPEIFILEASQEYLSSYPSSGIPSGRNSQIDTSRGGVGEFNPHKPVPPIRNSNHTGSVWNGTSSTAGTQTGAQTNADSAPHFLTSPPRVTGFSQTSSPFHNLDSLPSVRHNPVTSEVHADHEGEGQHVNRLTPITGSVCETTPTGRHMATQTPGDGLSVSSRTPRSFSTGVSKPGQTWSPASPLTSTHSHTSNYNNHDSPGPTGDPQTHKGLPTDQTESNTGCNTSDSGPGPYAVSSSGGQSLTGAALGANQHGPSDVAGPEGFSGADPQYDGPSVHPVNSQSHPAHTAANPQPTEGSTNWHGVGSPHSHGDTLSSDQVGHSGSLSAHDNTVVTQGIPGGRHTKHINNTSDDSGFSENDEQEKRKAADRIRGQGQSGKPMRRSHASGRVDGTPGSGAVNGSTDGQQGDASKRKDLQELERRRRQVLEEEARNQLEETERLDEDRRKWADGTLQEEEEENGRRGSAETGDSPHDDVSAESQEVERLLEQRDQPSSQSDDPVDVTDLKNRLTEELEKERAERLEIERRREELVKRAKALQNKTQQRRTHARDIWKKKYFDEKKKTNPLEEQTQRLRQELESLHRRIMSQLEGTKDGGRRSEGQPSMQSNLKIQATRMQHEIEDLQRRVENVKMKLTSEMKLRNQAETELRALRAELTQKKISMTINRNKTVNAAGTGAVDMTPRTPVPTQR